MLTPSQHTKTQTVQKVFQRIAYEAITSLLVCGIADQC